MPGLGEQPHPVVRCCVLAGVQLHPSPRAPCFGISRAGEPKAATSLAGHQNGSSGVAPHLSCQLEKWEADSQRGKWPAQPWGVCLEPVLKLVPQGTTPSSGMSCRAGHVGAVIFLQQGLHHSVPGPRQGGQAAAWLTCPSHLQQSRDSLLGSPRELLSQREESSYREQNSGCPR